MIWITTSFEGLHNYPDAPKDVEFLKNIHRHIFKIRVWISVEHNDRDIEFIMFKRYIEDICKVKYFSFRSCEMISDDLQEVIKLKYPDREIWIEISEDGENGSFKQYERGC